MSKAIILQHVDFEGPGRIVPVLRDWGVPIEVRHLYRGDAIPSPSEDIRLLIIMGGPMGVSDIGSEKFPFLADEVALLKSRITQDQSVLGVCLGAQLIAHAAGAKVYPNTRPATSPADPPLPLPEIGWGPITFPFPGGTEPIMFGMHDGASVFHWHFDTFDLPRLPLPPNAPPPPAPAPPTGNVLLASSRNCRNQAFRFKTRLIGFQFHIELTPDDIEGMLHHGKADVEKVLGPGGVEQIRQDTQKHYPLYQRYGDRVLRNLVEFFQWA